MIQRPFNIALFIENLHLTDTLRSFRQLLIQKAGIYGFQKIETGEIVYIGSTINLWKRQNNPAYGRTGELNPMFGVSAPNAQEIYIYGKDNVLIKSGKYLMNKYYITNKLITE
jgi:hypothetical protein